ncbi:MAG: GGDEF domain-containing protein [Candidatus Eremiobacteraeota bacterium]|nr:GGDEF domain-containing protein [Candidatus Eremiobacteraeota bacterium]MBC5827593.1 GGDEF domain-containing protein [Candidatus Eremiobacteraeota bacterium]
MKVGFRRLVGFVTGQSTPLPQAHRENAAGPGTQTSQETSPPAPPPSPDNAEPPADNDFATLLREGRIRTVFQAIVSLADGSVFGYEALSRGPIGTRLETAEALFHAAQRHRATHELERVCRFRAIASAASLPTGAFLFLNISPHVFDDPNAGLSREVMESSHLAQDRIVLEITEKEAIADFDRFKRTLLHYNAQGFKVAIDDAGAGHNSLRAVTEVRPHFIKLDMALVRDIDRDSAKNALVSAIIMFARRIDARVLGEGIETVDELATLIELGVHYGQGYLIARPGAGYAEPRAEISAFIRERSARSGGIPAPKQTSMISIARRIPALSPTALVSEVMNGFAADPERGSVVIVDNGVPVGLISRMRLYERLAQPFGPSVYAGRPARLVMDDTYLAVEGNESIDGGARKVIDRRRSAVYDDVVVLDNGFYFGTVSVHDLLHAMTKLQKSIARFSHPLTGLPNLIVLEREVNRRAAAATPFALLQVDINQFRAFNERYGFERGDVVIKALAACLVDTTKSFEGAEAVVTHLGGVDFAVACSCSAAERVGCAILDRWGRPAAEQFAGAWVTGEEDMETEVTLTIAGVSAPQAPMPPYVTIAERASGFRRMARGRHCSIFLMDGRVVRGPKLPQRRSVV